MDGEQLEINICSSIIWPYDDDDDDDEDDGGGGVDGSGDDGLD